uniref:Latent transforming growth factor beta binding protein 2 n=1 Tax=Oryzias sinensis TaxID=183150 RepID=A0A8C7Y8W6_9TELE
MEIFSRLSLLLLLLKQVCVCLSGANLTSNLDRIKIVFTPMMCNRVCNAGRCYNNCEKGDITTVFALKCNTGHALDMFIFCQIPCLNGGRCIGRDLCWCPSNSTGKFCHLAAPPPARPTPHSRTLTARHGAKSPSQSMYTLPLSNQQVSLHPSLVNVHIQHPPEAEVQVHQVARVQPGQRLANTEGVHSVQQRSQPGNGHEHPSEHGSRQFPSSRHENGHARTHSRQNEIVGRCFQETVDGQCGKPLPGLTKQDDCCGSIGASWGLNKCQKCPTKPAYAVIANGQVQCPKGFKRMNATHCQDINECLLPGICKNADCVNTKGSYRCTCKPGYMLDAARSHCVSDKAVSEERASCYRSVSSGFCSLPLANHLTKQICCCSRVGKAWGHGCDRCPLPGSDHFKEICPAGHGYTYSRSDVQISVRQLEDDELQSTGVSLEEQYPQFPSSQPSLLFPSEPQHPSYPQTPQAPQYPDYHNMPQIPHHPLSPQHPSYSENEECSSTPSICGRGKCISVQTGYTCLCDPGFKLSALRTNCIGKFSRKLFLFATSIYLQSLVFFYLADINECSMPNKCQNGNCVNTEGSYTCECNSGFAKSWRDQCEDLDECKDPSSCPRGICINTLGSFQCQACSPGLRLSNERCVDVDECVLPEVCNHGLCVNLDGTHKCTCNHGYQVTPDRKSCEDVNECATGNACPVGICINTAGSYTCQNCRPGFGPSADGLRCEGKKITVILVDWDDFWFFASDDDLRLTFSFFFSDINECQTPDVCQTGVCTNTEGSFSCMTCAPGFTVTPNGLSCEDVNECETSSALCGEALCENYDGSFLCICPTDNEEFDPITNRSIPSTDERKECYYNLNDANYCNNVLSRNTTKQECCCTAGAGWGDNCEIHTCPLPGKALFWQFFPPLRSITIVQISSSDANECEMFGSEICKNGQCSNIFSTYTCFCRSGYYYDNIRFECVDFDECQFGNTCENGACVNTAGSFNCFCSPPLVLDDSQRHCISLNKTIEYGQDVHEDICWQRLEGDNMCADPHSEPRTTFTECCCLHGVAWSGQCAFCPSKDSADYATMCNLPWEGGSDSLRDQIGVEYGPEGPPYWNNYVQHNAFEGLQAEECGILNGCENGRCVRVQEGYTCDCFDGYELDLSKMACVDINECEDISDKVPLCHNGQCTNTEGSYKCTCFAGFVASAKPHTCIPTIPDPKTRDSEN